MNWSSHDRFTPKIEDEHSVQFIIWDLLHFKIEQLGNGVMWIMLKCKINVL